MQTIGNDYEAKGSQYISGIMSLNSLIQVYPNENVIPQFIKLRQSHPFYRPVMGDGNCFYRAIAFLYLRQANLTHFSHVFACIQNVCKMYPIEFEGQTFEERLHKIYEKDIRLLANFSPVQRQDYLSDLFNKSFVFDTIMILYFRSLNYHYLRRYESMFRDYVTSQDSIERVRNFGAESEGVQYESMAKALSVRLIIQSVDQRAFNTITYNRYGSDIVYELILRPGHFDILYHKNSPYVFRQANPRGPLSDSYRSSYNNNFSSHIFESIQRSQQKSFIQQPIQDLYNRKNYPPSNFSRMKPEEQKKLFKTTQNPLESMGNLREMASKSSKLQNSIKQSSLKKDPNPLVHNVPSNKPKVSVQDYTAWRGQTPLQNGSLKRFKQIFIILLFLSGIGLILLKL